MSAPEAPPPVPRGEGPPFHAPWEAQTFALAVALQRSGLFTAAEWAAALAEAERGARTAGYAVWLAALEGLVVAKGAADPQALRRRREAWERAARATPHGRPVELPAGCAPD